MEITVNIDDQELIEAAKEVAIRRIADDIFSGFRAGNIYKNAVKECIREVIRQNIDDLSDRAVTAAAKTIENKAMKKMLDEGVYSGHVIKKADIPEKARLQSPEST